MDYLEKTRHGSRIEVREAAGENMKENKFDI
jgi:hypothetical protein